MKGRGNSGARPRRSGRSDAHTPLFTSQVLVPEGHAEKIVHQDFFNDFDPGDLDDNDMT